MAFVRGLRRKAPHEHRLSDAPSVLQRPSVEAAHQKRHFSQGAAPPRVNKRRVVVVHQHDDAPAATFSERVRPVAEGVLEGSLPLFARQFRQAQKISKVRFLIVRKTRRREEPFVRLCLLRHDGCEALHQVVKRLALHRLKAQKHHRPASEVCVTKRRILADFSFCEKLSSGCGRLDRAGIVHLEECSQPCEKVRLSKTRRTRDDRHRVTVLPKAAHPPRLVAGTAARLSRRLPFTCRLPNALMPPPSPSLNAVVPAVLD